jgi:hypothetical protein
MDLLAITYLLLFFTLAWSLIYIGYIFEQRMMARRQGWERLLVIVPQGLINPFTEHRFSEINQSTELYKRLGELHIPFTLETAVHSVGEEIHFYILVPRFAMKKTVKLIESLWPTGYVAHADEYDLWLAETPAEGGHIAGAYLTQAKPFCIPLKTAFKGHFEPFLGVLRRLSGLAAVGEGAAIQWIVRPADPRLINDIADHLQKFRGGEYHPSRHVHERFILTPETIKLLEAKARSPLFAVNCRVVAAGARGNGKAILKELVGHMEEATIAGDQHNAFTMVSPKNANTFLDSYFNRRFESAHEMILTADELATYFHFPGPHTATPKIKRTEIRLR